MRKRLESGTVKEETTNVGHFKGNDRLRCGIPDIPMFNDFPNMRPYERRDATRGRDNKRKTELPNGREHPDTEHTRFLKKGRSFQCANFQSQVSSCR
jgi:hypothetical protein